MAKLSMSGKQDIVARKTYKMRAKAKMGMPTTPLDKKQLAKRATMMMNAAINKKVY